ncbi:hypothetical protein AYO21_07644 [Fonsecaea monophora]|uniref:Uncharacterized protein n=1 Tax=Fonsecaea monophora TaxID=254056 RepID=A0A177F1I5_9EURO|nr:hypothetical protein AYO21_07644 [Fonsecaea monophora]OAG38184.1 hypothetical protein AYO21_07644 [Fonsecaea monophora]
MPPQTRSTYRHSTPDRGLNTGDYDTVKKTRFFEAWDARQPGQSLRSITQAHRIDKKTGSNWLQQRLEIGSPAYRRTRPQSQILGRPSKIEKRQIQTLLSPSKNPYRNDPYEAQIAYFDLRVSARQLRRRLTQLTKNAQLYKAVYYKDELSKETEKTRVEYGKRHAGKTVENFWQWVYFTDEFHFDPTSQRAPRVLRETGARYNQENIVPRAPKKGIVLHAAGWVNWHAKCPELLFWHDRTRKA